MANPYLVLGGIAVGIVTAGFGILQVPGWISEAHDAAVTNDLSNVREIQSAAAAQSGGYLPTLDPTAVTKLGMTTGTSASTRSLDMTATSDAWCAVALSESGKYIAVSSTQTSFGKGPTAEAATAAAGCETGAEGEPGNGGGALRDVTVQPSELRRAAALQVADGNAAWAPQGGVRVLSRGTRIDVSSSGAHTSVQKAGDYIWADTDNAGNAYGINPWTGFLNKMDPAGNVTDLLYVGEQNTGHSLSVADDGTLHVARVLSADEVQVYRVDGATLTPTVLIDVPGPFINGELWGGIQFAVADDESVTFNLTRYDAEHNIHVQDIFIAHGDGSLSQVPAPSGGYFSGGWSNWFDITPTGGVLADVLYPEGSSYSDDTAIYQWEPSGESRHIDLPFIVRSADMGEDGALAMTVTNKTVGSMAADGTVTILSAPPGSVPK
jgi:hypothetical protein